MRASVRVQVRAEAAGAFLRSKRAHTLRWRVPRSFLLGCVYIGK